MISKIKGIYESFSRYRLNVDFWRNYIMQLQAWGIRKVRDDSKSIHRQCPICGEDNENIVLKAPVYDFVSCKKCSLVYAKYILNDKEIGDFYKDNEIYQSGWMKTYDDLVKNKDVSTHNSIIINILKHRKGDDRCLDVGCGFGKLLYELKPYFKKVEGVELNVRTSKIGEKLFDIPICTKKLEELNLPSDSYDVIILEQVIEHLNNFNSLFNEFYRILKEGGIIYIGCPNMNSWSMKLFRGRHTHVSSHGHINMFNTRSFSFLAKKYKFKVKKIDSTSQLDIVLSDMLYFCFNSKNFVHRYNYDDFIGPISLFVDPLLQGILQKSNVLRVVGGGAGSYLEGILEK